MAFEKAVVLAGGKAGGLKRCDRSCRLRYSWDPLMRHVVASGRGSDETAVQGAGTKFYELEPARILKASR